MSAIIMNDLSTSKAIDSIRVDASCVMRQQMATVGTHGSDSVAVCGADRDAAN